MVWKDGVMVTEEGFGYSIRRCCREGGSQFD